MTPELEPSVTRGLHLSEIVHTGDSFGCPAPTRKSNTARAPLGHVITPITAVESPSLGRTIVYLGTQVEKCKGQHSCSLIHFSRYIEALGDENILIIDKQRWWGYL